MVYFLQPIWYGYKGSYNVCAFYWFKSVIVNRCIMYLDLIFHFWITVTRKTFILFSFHNIFFLTQKGKEVIEYYINELISEGVSTIPRWQPPEGLKSKEIEIPSSEDTPSQDSGLRSRTNSSASQHSRSSVSSLVLGASAATIKSPVSDGINLLQLYDQLVLCLLEHYLLARPFQNNYPVYHCFTWSKLIMTMVHKDELIAPLIYQVKRLKVHVHVKIYFLSCWHYVLKMFSL